MSEEVDKTSEAARGIEDAAGAKQKAIENLGVLDLTWLRSPHDLKGITTLRNVGVILIREGAMEILGGTTMQNVGQVVSVPDGEKISMRTGQITLTEQSLAEGDKEAILIVAGQVFITAPIKEVGYKDLWVFGQILVQRGVELPRIGKFSGQVIHFPPGARFAIGEETWGREFLELLPTPTAYVVIGRLKVDNDVAVDILKSKITEIVLAGQIEAPRALVPILQVLTVEKMGRIVPRDG